MKKVKHWLHILLIVLTSGIWILPYVVILATTEMYNRGYRIGKAAGRVERQNEIDEERAKPKFMWESAPNCRCVVKPIVPVEPKPKSRVDRFAELAKPDLVECDACPPSGGCVRTCMKAAPVVERQPEPFMYGIMQPDGTAHCSELCVSGEASDLESEVESMNEDSEGYRVVPLYTSPPAPVAVVLPERMTREQALELTDYPPESAMYWYNKALDDVQACLDKVKELNP